MMRLPRTYRDRVPVALACGVALLAALVLPAKAQDEDDAPSLDDTPHITLTGTARTEVAPDIADISIGVTTEDRDAAKASEANSAVARKLTEAAKAEGIGSADIRTQSVELTEVFDNVRQPDDTFRQVPRGFKASYMLGIRVRALDRAGVLAQKLIALGANRFDGIGFSVEHPDAINTRLLGEAVRDARNQAAIVAEAAGIKFGRILSITRPGSPVAAKFAPRARAMAAAPAMPVEAGTQAFDVDIEVTWAIAP